MRLRRADERTTINQRKETPMPRMTLAAIAAVLLIFISPAQAKTKHHKTTIAKTSITCGYDRGVSLCPVTEQAPMGRRPGTVAVNGYDVASGDGVVGGRPPECNIRIRGRLIPYCGCETSLKVFGKVIPELMLAYNWRKFPRANPASGMVAYRSGHVFYIQSVIDSETVVAYDPNSGGSRTRIHTVSLRGYHVVDPNGNRVAMNTRN